MSFDFYLYRAAPDCGPLLEWEEDHAEPLGTAAEVRAEISAAFPELVWSECQDGSWRAESADDDAETIEVSLRSTREDSIQYVITYAAPPVLRRLMETLRLNFCCAPESGEMRDPFAVADRW